MASVESRLEALGLQLPAPAAPAANYVPFVIAGKTLFIAGQIPFYNGQRLHIARLGQDYTVEQGQDAARVCALNILAQAKEAVGGDWGKIRQCVKLGGFVNSTADFDQHPAVINGASEVMAAALGDAGKHARFAVGAPNLPFGVAVEIDAIFELV